MNRMSQNPKSKEMKKYILTLFLITLVFSSCEFLDVVPDDTVQLNDAFKNESLADGYMYSCYSNMPAYASGNYNYSWWVSNEIVGTPGWGLDFFQFMKIQQGLYSASSPVFDFWSRSYEGIRKSFVMLNNIDIVQNKNMGQADFEKIKKDWIGQSYFLIGYYHYILMELYGPIILIDKEMPYDGSGDDYFRKRRPVSECAEFIAEIMDKAIEYLPDTRQEQEYGKPTKLIAQSFKAKAYFLSASPLFNGNTDSFFSKFANKDGELLMAESYDKERWKKAMDELKTAINMAKGSGYDLYKYSEGKNLSSFDQAIADARYTLLDSWNKEIIWAYTGERSTGPANYYAPRGISSNASVSVGGVSPSLKTVEMFYTKNGKPYDADPEFDWNSRYQVEEGSETCNLNLNREPRFYAWIGYDRGPYEVNNDTITLKMKQGETNGVKESPDKEATLYTGYAIKKMVHPRNRIQGNEFIPVQQFFTLLRLSELYLSYCEACAEYQGSFDADALSYFNAIRKKAGIPSLAESFGNISGDNLVNVVRRERMIEFMFEGFWSNDLKRWMIAEQFYSDDKDGMWGLNVMGKDNASFYTRTRLSRFMNFDKKNYLFPITHSYVVKGNINLVQNPGW